VGFVCSRKQERDVSVLPRLHDYHRDRFYDYSLLVLDRGQVLGVLPANQADDRIYSHQGLTYGGLITLPQMTTPRFLDAFSVVLDYFRAVGIRRLFYKTMPTIYHRLPAEEDRYALFWPAPRSIAATC